MADHNGATGLEDLLLRICKAGNDPDKVLVADIRTHLGARAFGPLLLVPVLPTLTPISTVPGVPSFVGIMTILTSSQMLLGLPTVWLPQVVLKRSLDRKTIGRVVSWLLPVARFVDRFTNPRLGGLTEPPVTYVIALCCLILGLIMLPLEIVPFTSAIPAVPVAIFALSLTTRDGVLVIAGFVSMALALGLLGAILSAGRALLGL